METSAKAAVHPITKNAVTPTNILNAFKCLFIRRRVYHAQPSATAFYANRITPKMRNRQRACREVRHSRIETPKRSLNVFRSALSDDQPHKEAIDDIFWRRLERSTFTRSNRTDTISSCMLLFICLRKRTSAMRRESPISLAPSKVPIPSHAFWRMYSTAFVTRRSV